MTVVKVILAHYSPSLEGLPSQVDDLVKEPDDRSHERGFLHNSPELYSPGKTLLEKSEGVERNTRHC